MSRRSYQQYCGLAVALDLVGERWTMLLLRNLLVGPKRFKDLHEGLPGIGTGLLSERLKQLEAAGLIARARLPPPSGVTVYELTADGEELRPVLVGLARWGLRRLGDPADFRFADPDTLAVAVEASFDPARADGADGSYALTIDDRAFGVEIADGTIHVTSGAPPAPAASLSTDLATAIDLNRGATTVAAAADAGRLTLSGDPAAAAALARALGL